MQTETTSQRKKSSRATSAPPAEAAAPPLSRVVKRAPPPPPAKDKDGNLVDTPPKQMPAGEYRIIHGQMCIPLDPKEYTDSTGQIIDGKPRVTYAKPGDIVWLSEQDATNANAADLIEEVDAKPSRLGKVWQPPKSGKNLGGS